MLNVFTLLTLLFPLCLAAQRPTAENPKTILWKISGNGLKEPSYLLGTHHLLEMEWLMQFPNIKAAIDSPEYILTEAFSSEPLAAAPVPQTSPLKGVSILSPAEYQTVDSFFVARVGEGIRNNPDAEGMSVPELSAAILSTLVQDQPGANGVTKLMDLDLFNYFRSKGKGGDRLDRVKDSYFDSSRIADARKVLRQAINLIPGSDQPNWNIYSGNKDIRNIILSYKEMNAPYQLTEIDTSETKPADYYQYQTMEERNRSWIPKIQKNIAAKPCLIAVGFGHLKYKHSLILLLREQGYRVEPVLPD